MCLIKNLYHKSKKAKTYVCYRVRTCAGYPMGFQVPRLNHSAKMTIYTFIGKLDSFKAVTKMKKLLTICYGTVILPWNYIQALREHLLKSIIHCVIDENLICAFSDLSSLRILKAATK